MTAFKNICHFQDTVIEILSGFTPVYLCDLPADSQMSRFDSKYIFPGYLIPKLVEKAKENYKILEINQKRLLEYKSQYFDTENFRMYYDHHNGKGERFKIRMREYIDSQDIFLEIKKKTNKGLMIKQRIPLPDSSIHNENARKLIEMTTPVNPDELTLSLCTDFKRFTLINKNGWERITIDMCMTIWRNGDKITLPWLGIAEIKKPDQHTKVKFEEILKESSIYPANFSKYCTGMAYLNSSVKYNNFKKNLLTIKHFENEYFNHVEH